MIPIKNSKMARCFLRALSIALVHTFLLSSIAFAAPQEKTPDIAAKEVVTNPESIVIQKDFGIIKSKFTGNSGKLVVHIQDAHCNYEAQSNIARMLEALVKNDGLKLVSVEGADGAIDTSWFKAFPDDSIRKEVADYFMKKGEITGPEFLSITTDLPIKLFGAETRAYYLDNLNAFTSSYPLKAETEKHFNTIKAALNRLKDFIYNDDLKLMDAKKADYDSKKIQFNEYIRFLQAEAEKNGLNLREYENLFKLINVLIYEKKIDFNVTDKERSSLIDEVTKKLSKDGVNRLVTQSISFKIGKISSAEYYNYLRNLATANGIDLAASYPNLYNYIIYNSVYSRIENEKLFHEITLVENAIKEKLFRNDDQRTLEMLSRHIATLIGLVNIELLNGDFEYYKNHKDEFTTEAFTDFIGKKASQYGLAVEISQPSDAVSKSITKLEDFYAIAIKRDKALLDNTLAAMDKDGEKIAVLVTGGFHSEGIARMLEKQGISYVVICPSITKDVPSPYIQVLTNQRTSFEDIIMGAAEPAQAGMLAPIPMSFAINLSKEEFQRILDSLNNKGLADRVENFEKGWVISHSTIWLQKTRELVARMQEMGPHRMAEDISLLKDAYKAAVAKAAAEAKVSEQKLNTINAIISLQEFDDAFRAVYERITSGPAVVSMAQPVTVRTIAQDVARASESLKVAAGLVLARTINDSGTDRARLLDSLAGSAKGVTRLDVLRSMAEAGMAVITDENALTYTLTDKFFDPQRLAAFLKRRPEVAIPGLHKAIMDSIDPEKYIRMLSKSSGRNDQAIVAALEREGLFPAVVTRLGMSSMPFESRSTLVMGTPPTQEAASATPLAQAYSSPEALDRYVAEVSIPALIEAVPNIEQRMKEYRALTDSKTRARLSDAINADIRRQYNSKIAADTAKVNFPSMTAANVVTRINTPADLPKLPGGTVAIENAGKLLVSPRIGRIDLWAGAASGLFGEGQNVDTSLSYAAHDVYQVVVSRGQNIAPLIAQGAIPGISMATRLMVQEWLNLEERLMRSYQANGITKTAEEITAERKNIVWNTPRIIVVNDESGPSIIKDFVDNNFYGHNPATVAFVLQPTHYGFDIDNGASRIVETTRPVPVGHADALMQAVQKGRAFTVDETGRPVAIEDNAVSYLMTKRPGEIDLFLESRVNDMLKLETPGTKDTDLEVLARSLLMMEDLTTLNKGNNVIFELVSQDLENPIKGSSPLQADGKRIMVEILAQDDNVARIIFFKPDVLTRTLKSEGLPIYLRFRDGYVYPETVTSDLTMLKDTRADFVSEPTRQIKDYKDGDKTLPKGIDAALKQDKNPQFRNEADEVRKNRKNVALEGLDSAISSVIAGERQAARRIEETSGEAIPPAMGIDTRIRKQGSADMAAPAHELSKEYIYNTYIRESEQLMRSTLIEMVTGDLKSIKPVIIAIDTKIDPNISTALLRAGEVRINEYLGGMVIEVRGTGKALLEGVERAKIALQEKMKKLGRESSEIAIASMIGDSTKTEIESQLKAGRTLKDELGPTLNINNPDKKYIDIIGFYDVLLRMAYLGRFPKDSDLDAVLLRLNRIAFNKDGEPFTRDDLLKGAIRGMPRIKAIDDREYAMAYEAAKQALSSL